MKLKKSSALIVLTFASALSLVSCGKNGNKIQGGTGGSSSVFNQVTVGTPGAANLGSKIDNYQSQFGTGLLIYNYQSQTWTSLLQYGLNLNYRYTRSTTSPSSTDCKEKWIFYICSTSSTSTSYSVVESRKVSNNTVDVTAKANELKALINSTSSLVPISNIGTSYYIQTTNGNQYVIDTQYPLQANPIAVRDVNGTEYLYNITQY